MRSKTKRTRSSRRRKTRNKPFVVDSNFSQEKNRKESFKSLNRYIPRKMLIVDGSEVEEVPEVSFRYRGIRECLAKSDIIVKLSLSGNLLTSFDIKAGDLPNLRVLGLSDNQLTSFVVGDLPNLQVLTLSINLLTSFVIEPGDLPNLQVLTLSSNELTSFVIESGDLPNLQVLYLSNNQLTSFVIGDFPNLKELYLSFVPLSVLPLVLRQIPKLRALSLRGTGVKFVDPSLKKFTTKEIKTRSHVLGLHEMLRIPFEIDNHPVLEEIMEHIEV